MIFCVTTLSLNKRLSIISPFCICHCSFAKDILNKKNVKKIQITYPSDLHILVWYPGWYAHPGMVSWMVCTSWYGILDGMHILVWYPGWYAHPALLTCNCRFLNNMLHVCACIFFFFFFFLLNNLLHTCTCIFFNFLNNLLHTCNCIFPNNLLWWKRHAEEFKVSVEVGCMFACFWVQRFSLESVWVGAATGLQGGDCSSGYGLSFTLQLFFFSHSILVNLSALAKER